MRGQVLSELGRVYRELRRGEINATDAKAMSALLVAAANVMKDSEAQAILDQIAALRAQLNPTMGDDDAVTVITPPLKQVASH